MKINKVFLIGFALLLAVSMTAMASGVNQQHSGPVTTITVWSNDAHDKAEMDLLVAQFNATTGAQKGIRVEYSVYGADWNTAINMALETDRAPDMFKAGFANYENFQAMGRFLPWTDIPGIQDILEKQAPYHRNLSSTFGGVPYGVVVYGNIPGFHYNKALLRQAGFSAPPKTWAELEQMSIAISRLASDVYGIGIPLLWAPDFCHWVTEYAATNSIGHMYWNFTTGTYNFAAFTEYFEMLSRIREAGAVFPGMESLTDDQLRAQFAAGKVGFIWGASWNVGVLYDQFPFQPSDGWDFAPFPVKDVNNQFRVPFSASAAFHVSSQVRNNPTKLAGIGDVIRLFIGDDTQRLMFTTGKRFPIRTDITSSAAPAVRPQWTSIGNSSPLGFATMPSAPHNLLAVEGPDRAAVIGQILTGQIPTSGIRAALTDLDTRMNAAFNQAVQRGQLVRTNYISPNFETQLRAR
ncbi:MAG: ABC transporter substrate-binding protein [Treponema sp.]|jgi:multiple sugar transport system substrate-binding protein|nr:ABC transporter substrate-binding protein [Treponema sp.]